MYLCKCKQRINYEVLYVKVDGFALSFFLLSEAAVGHQNYFLKCRLLWNRLCSCCQYWTGATLEWRLIPGNVIFRPF